GDVQHQDGGRRTVQFYKAAFRNPDGTVGGLVGAMLDVTERKEAEHQLQAARRRAERAVEERTRFVAAASHDLRQPLHALSLFVGRLQEQARESGQLEELARDIRLCTDSLVELFDSLMDISKLDAGALSPALEDVPLRPLLDRIATDHAPFAEQRGLRLRTAGPALTAHSDPALLERLLRNLVANAVRYTSRGGILLACRRRGANLRIEVWDTGPGIPETEHAAIFREFYQGQRDDRPHGQGLGLGLSIVQRLAALLDSPVDLCSRPGRGTVFRVEVPVGQPVPRTAPAAAATAGSLADLRVLAVDDEAAALSALRTTLEGWGCTVETAADGDQARDRAGAAAPDVVLCDYRLAGDERGPDVIHRLRQICGPELPAALVTGDTSTSVQDAARAAGCRLLVKPLRPAKLRALLTGLTRTADG
ncbi:MAG TPA: hybrid sensor histidine kinase/response regulator, partial [Gammaproteobacteria bacterium]|nr:hybrid sensor histidine kinase/response regulator [Gammaproteobacteria bacterium]